MLVRRLRVNCYPTTPWGDHQCAHNLTTRVACSLLEPRIRCEDRAPRFLGVEFGMQHCLPKRRGGVRKSLGKKAGIDFF